MNDEIRSAIKRSEAYNDIVHVAVDCTTATLRALLASIAKCDWDMCEIEDNKVDVWGWSDATPEGEQDWRLCVQCVAADELVA